MTIADSSAFRDDRRLLTQHQAALTLLQSVLADPSVERLHWLDVACGRGQILLALEENLSSAARAKVVYHAFDADQRFLRETEQTALALGLARVEMRLGELADFDRLLERDQPFDFVTFTNTAHEIRPSVLARILVDLVLRLAPRGCLFVYDMEYVHPPELGAIPWSSAEFVSVVRTLMVGLGVTGYEPPIGRWRHSSTVGWSLQIHRQHLGTIGLGEGVHQNATAAVAARMRELLKTKLLACTNSLESITRFGIETADEEQHKVRQLYDYWSIRRALEIEDA